MKKVEIIKTYYEENHKEGRADHEILGWESRQAQRKRFEILVLNVDLEGKSLLDVGCGLGNMLEFIEEKKKNFVSLCISPLCPFSVQNFFTQSPLDRRYPVPL